MREWSINTGTLGLFFFTEAKHYITAQEEGQTYYDKKSLAPCLPTVRRQQQQFSDGGNVGGENEYLESACSHPPSRLASEAAPGDLTDERRSQNNVLILTCTKSLVSVCQTGADMKMYTSHPYLHTSRDMNMHHHTCSWEYQGWVEHVFLPPLVLNPDHVGKHAGSKRGRNQTSVRARALAQIVVGNISVSIRLDGMELV